MGKPKAPKTKPPALPAPAATMTEMTESAQRAGTEEGERLRKRTGRRSTQITTPGFMAPAKVDRAKLKTSLG